LDLFERILDKRTKKAFHPPILLFEVIIRYYIFGTGKHILNKVEKYLPAKSGISSGGGSNPTLNEMHLMSNGII
jgi:hypothetical protein